MRRPLLAVTTAAAALATAAALLVSGPTAAAEPLDPADSATTAERAEQVSAEEALDVAAELLGEGAGVAPSAEDAELSASTALLELWQQRDELEGRDRARADSLLARPTDGGGPRGDPYGDGYTVDERQPTCGDEICVHSVAATPDRATERQVTRTLEVMASVHAHHVGKLGWRAPLADGARGGSANFDVYLADVGERGLYGYCVPERYVNGKQASGYCVLDNDFADAAFGDSDPGDNLTVTAAHEYLHAIQYAYDATEDTWLFEATATWMEEQYADDINDNRQYLAGGQLRVTQRSLDRFGVGSRGIYGNWIFFEHLANRFRPDVVRQVWEIAGRNRSSVPAVAAALSARGTDLRAAYTLFAADNTVPGRSAFYHEGGEWGLKAPMARSATLDRSKRATGWWDLRLDHLTSGTVAIRSRGYADGNRLRVELDPPAASTSPAAYVIVHRKDSTVSRRYVALGAQRKLFLDFASARVDRVTVTLANGSPGQDRQPFRVRATAVR